MKVSIVIPVYNEEKFIEKCLDEVLAADTLSMPKEIIVVDDGSSDKTKEVIARIVKKNPKTIKLIKQPRNMGKGAALKRGLGETTGEIVIVQDADLEYSPTDYPVMLSPFTTNDADVVYGSRFISNRPHRVLYFWHYQINKILTTLSNMLTNLNFTDMETGYKAFKGELIRKIAPELESQRFGFEPEITAKIAKVPRIKIYEVGIGYAGRTYEEGKKIGWKDGIMAIWEILYFNLLK